MIQFIFYNYSMGNKWLAHLAQYRKMNKDVKPQEMMKKARKSYQSGGKFSVKDLGHDVSKTVSHTATKVGHDIKKGGDSPTPYVQPNKMNPMPVGALDPIRMFGGAVVPFEPAGTDSRPATVGGRRRTRRQQRSRRTRRR